jgi:hypothetical protein
MATAIRDVTGSELRLFGDIVARLERLGPESDARAVIFMDVMRLLRSDFGASYVWNPRKNRFDEAVSFNMERTNLRRYEEWYQFRELLFIINKPLTFHTFNCNNATKSRVCRSRGGPYFGLVACIPSSAISAAASSFPSSLFGNKWP